jgi:hypothetical protein
MPDFFPHDSAEGGRAPGNWHDAFTALPLEAAPSAGWSAIATRLEAKQRRRRWSKWSLPLAAAAVLLLALAPAWWSRPTTGTASPPSTQSVARATSPGANADSAALEPLYAESARLEALLQYARDPRVASGTAAAISAELDAQVGSIDAALMQPGLSVPRKTALWRERVQVLRAFAGFESTRRWLAANGERYDGALVRVD